MLDKVLNVPLRLQWLTRMPLLKDLLFYIHVDSKYWIESLKKYLISTKNRDDAYKIRSRTHHDVVSELSSKLLQCISKKSMYERYWYILLEQRDLLTVRNKKQAG